MSELGQEGKTQPNFSLCSTVVSALANAGHVERAHKVLNSVIRHRPQLDDDAQNPSDTMENKSIPSEPFHALEGCNPVLSIMKAYLGRLTRQPTVVKAQMENFMTQMDLVASKTNDTEMSAMLHPTIDCYCVMISAYTQLRLPRQAEDVLRHVFRRRSTLHSTAAVVVLPDTNSIGALTVAWNAVLEAWAHSGAVETVPRCFYLLESMLKLSESDRSCQPTTETFNIILSCLADDRRNTRVKNAQAAQLFFDRMDRGEHGDMCKPNRESYDVVLRAWCQAGYPDKADSLLHRFCSDAEKSPETALMGTKYPSSKQFITVMHGWAKIARRRNGRHLVLQHIARLLQTMRALHTRGFPTKPSLTAYNVFLECLAMSHGNDASEHADAFLRLVEDTTLIDSNLVPDAVVFNSVLSALLRSNRKDAPTRASELFIKMQSLHTATGKSVNSFSYATLIEIYVQHTLPERAQKTFDEMVQTNLSAERVPLFAYTSLMHAWAMAGKPKKAMETVKLLRQDCMLGKLTDPSKRATHAFNALLNSLSQSNLRNAATFSELCLETMDMIASSGQFDAHANLASYSLVIHALVRSHRQDAGYRSLQLFKRLKSLYLKSGDASVCPDLRVYSHVVAALTKNTEAATSVYSVESVDQIHALLDEIGSLVRPTCWGDQGKMALSRIAFFILESGFTTTEKTDLIQKLWELAGQHAVKLDLSIEMLLRTIVLSTGNHSGAEVQGGQ